MYVCIYVGGWRREVGKERKGKERRIPIKGGGRKKGIWGCRGGGEGNRGFIGGV